MVGSCNSCFRYVRTDGFATPIMAEGMEAVHDCSFACEDGRLPTFKKSEKLQLVGDKNSGGLLGHRRAVLGISSNAGLAEFAPHSCDLEFSVLILGIGAFVFKKKSRKWYGLVEIIVAWFTAVSISTRIVQGQLDLTTVMSLAGTIYIVSRGLDNIDYADENAKGTSPDQSPVGVPGAD